MRRWLFYQHRHGHRVASQSLPTFAYADQVLPAKHGYPMRLRMSTKLGYKNPKHVTEFFVSNANLGGYSEDQGNHWFGGS